MRDSCLTDGRRTGSAGHDRRSSLPRARRRGDDFRVAHGAAGL